MKTYRELIYLILDELKLISDDSLFTEDHVLFLLTKYRALLLKLKYPDIKKQIPNSNYQTICLEVMPKEEDNTIPDRTNNYLYSKEEIPSLINIVSPRVYSEDYYDGEISYVSRDRMKYTGYNKYLKNIIYCSINYNNHLYLKLTNKDLNITKVKMTAVFENPERIHLLLCDNTLDILDTEFPIEESLILPLVLSCIRELSGSIYKPKDETNNAKDDLEDLASFIARNAKSKLLKLLE